MPVLPVVADTTPWQLANPTLAARFLLLLHDSSPAQHQKQSQPRSFTPSLTAGPPSTSFSLPVPRSFQHLLACAAPVPVPAGCRGGPRTTSTSTAQQEPDQTLHYTALLYTRSIELEPTATTTTSAIQQSILISKPPTSRHSQRQQNLTGPPCLPPLPG